MLYSIPMLWSIGCTFPVGAGMAPPESGVSMGVGRSTGVVGIRISVGFLSGEAGVIALGAVVVVFDGGGMRDEPLDSRGTSGMLAGAKSSVLRCRGALGGGGRKGVESIALDCSATMMVGT